MKRYIYIILGIIAAAVVAILILLFIKDRSSTNTTSLGTTGTLPAVGGQTNPVAATTTGTETSTGLLSLTSLPSSTATTSGGATGQQAAGTFGILSNQPVLDYFVNAQNVITGVQPSGAIITIANGQSTVLNTSTINDIISASFSYDGQKILVSSGNPSDPQASLFDMKTQTWTTLTQSMLSPQWSSNSYQIAYLTSANTGKLSLSIINAANIKSGVATLVTLNANDMTLQWPNKTQFILSDKPSADTQSSLWLFNSQNGSLTSIDYEDTGIESIWSHSTSTIGLVFSTGPTGQNPDLLLESTLGTGVKNLNFITLPSKCAFNIENNVSSTSEGSSSSVALYCGIPRSTSAFYGASLPDSYNMMALFTADDIYKIDTTSGATEGIFSDQTQNLDTSDLKIFNGTLFFVNRYDQKLYGVVL